MMGKRVVIDRNNLPTYFPTHKHSMNFWEHLGRTVATYSFLEEILKRAIFTVQGTRQYSSKEEAETAYNKWIAEIDKKLTDTLYKLAEAYEVATSSHQDFSDQTEIVKKLVSDIKKASETRNVLCHGSWGVPDDDGKSLPFFVRKERGKKSSHSVEFFETPVDLQFLEQVRNHVVHLICDVMDSITSKGWQFPGGTGPGKPVF
jgi:hypothetical protein